MENSIQGRRRPRLPARHIAGRSALLAGLVLGLAASAGRGAAQEARPEDKRSIAELVEALAGELPFQRKQAAEALAAKGKAALPAVRRALKDRDWKVRRGATDALAALGADGLAAAPQLAAALKDKDAWVRAGAAAALGKMETLPADAVQALAAACTDPDKWVRESAVRSLGSATKDKKILLTTAVAVVRLPDSGWGVRRHAMGILNRHGKDYKPAVPALIEMLTSPSEGMWDCSGSAVQLLAGMGEGKRAVPILIKRLDSKNRGVPRNAAGLLGKIGADAAAALPALRKVAATHEDKSYRSAAAQAVETIEAARKKEGGK